MTKPWDERVNLPREEGFYWARTEGMNWWNFLVYVHGNEPFFKLDAWAYTLGSMIANANIFDIEEFGPRVEAPLTPQLWREAKGKTDD